MSKAKQNTFLIGYFSALAVGAGVLGYLAWTSSDAAAEARDGYDTAKTKLASLQKAPIFPKQENVDAKKKQVNAFADQVKALKDSLLTYQVPIAEGMNNSDFQTKLQKTRDATAVEAKNAGVKLPENFDLGFGTYLSTFPETEAVPRLNAWLDGVQFFVSSLIASGVKEVGSLTRPELPFEKKNDAKPAEATPVGKPKPAPKSPAGAKGKAAEAAPLTLIEEKAVLERYPFNVTFTASNRSVNELLTTLANTGPANKSPFFYNIRVLRIENEQKNGAETSAQINITEANDPDTQKPFKRDSAFIFGIEKVQVHLGIDLIRFAETEVTEPKK